MAANLLLPPTSPDARFGGRHADLTQLFLGLGLQRFGQLVEHFGRLVDPAALLACLQIDLSDRLPEAERTITRGQLRIDDEAS